MSDILQQAVLAIQTGDYPRAGRLLSQVLQADPHNASAWVWLARLAGSEEKRRACLERAAAIAPTQTDVQQALLDWILTQEGESLPPARSSLKSPAMTPPRPGPPLPASPGTSLQEFLLHLTKNYNILKEREAKYGSTAAPLDLLNQIDDYEHAIALTQEAIDRTAPLEELQDEFASLNLQISTVIFVAQEPPRKPFKGLNPYRGLLKFTEDDAQFFFGRNAAIQSLLQTVQYLVDTETSQQLPDLITVLGPSGSGKSSLVRAGLIPALRAGRVPGSSEWPLKVMLPGSHPLDALAELFIGSIPRDLAAIRASLNGGEKALHELIVESLALAKLPEEKVFVLVIDQFEETFTLGEDETERRAFIDQILYAAQARRNRAFICLTMRSDFYSKVAAYKRLAEVITRNQMLVSPMTEKELREAVLLPAEAVGLELEKALVESLLRDTANAPGVLPLLQHALLELFHRREGNLLTLEAYNEIGGVKGALAHRADSVINELDAARQKIVQRIFMRLVQPGEGVVDTRRRAAFSEVLSQDTQPQEVEAVVRTLADANLIVTSHNPESDEVTLDVAHEALIQEWPLLRHWLAENRESLRIQQQMSQAARDWQARRRDEDSLYRGARLLEVEEWAAAHPGELNPLEQAFLTTSIEFREREATAKEAQRQRELEQAHRLAEEQRQRADEQRRTSVKLRRRALVAAGIGLLALLAAIAAVWFGVQSNQNAQIAQANANLAATRQAEAGANANLAATRAAEAQASAHLAATRQAEAEQQARLARAGQLAAQAQTAPFDRSPQGLLLAVEAISTTLPGDPFLPTPGEALRALLQKPWGFPLSHSSEPLTALRFSPECASSAEGCGHWLIAAGDTTVRFWSVTDLPAEPAITLEGLTPPITFSPDGQWLAAAGADNILRLWSTQNPAAEPVILTGGMPPITFSSDSQWLVASAAEGTLQVWPLRKPQAKPVALEGATQLAVFSPDGRWLTAADDNGAVKLWSLADLQTPPVPLEGDGGPLGTLFSPDGKWLAAGNGVDTAWVWSLTDLQAAPARLQNVLTLIGFTGDNQWLIGAGPDLKAQFWSVQDFQADPLILPGSEGIIVGTTILFSPDNNWLATSGLYGPAKLWSLRDKLARPLDAGTDNSVASFSSDGQWLGVGSSDGKMWLVSLAQPQAEPVVRPGHTGNIGAVSFSPDGRWFVTGGADSTVRLWSVADPQSDPIVLPGHTGGVGALVFSPDGRWLLTGDGSGSVQLWPLRQLQAEPLIFGAVPPLALSPAGQWLATASISGSVHLWSLADPQPEPLVLGNEAQNVGAIAFSPDGQWLLSSGYGTPAQLWSMAEPGEKPVLLPGAAPPAAFSPDGRWLASGSEDGLTTQLWSMENLQAKPILFESPASTLAFSPDGQWLAINSSTRLQLQAVDNPSADPLLSSDSETGFTDLAFSLPCAGSSKECDLWLAAGGADGSVWLWSLTEPSADPVTLDNSLSGPVQAVAFSPDGQWLAAGGVAGGRLWSMQDIEAEPVLLRGHQGDIYTLAFSPDSQWLATGSDDFTARLWSLSQLQAEPVVLRGHQGPVVTLAFSPDGQSLITGSGPAFLKGVRVEMVSGVSLTNAQGDGTIRVWRVHQADLMREACQLAGRNFTGAEWQQFMGDVPYRRTCPDFPAGEEVAQPAGSN